MLTRITDGLTGHLADRYRTAVTGQTGLTELDVGVFRVDRAEGAL